MSDSGNPVSSGTKRWELDREALAALLKALAPEDPALAGRRYEQLRTRLIDLFAWERCGAPDELADSALNRVAHKLAEGAVVPHVDRYAFGIARFLIHEAAREQRKHEAALRELQVIGGGPSGEDLEALQAIRTCLNALPRAGRDLIERYYSEDRAGLAERMGISVNALRNRALRIRDELYRCMSAKRAPGRRENVRDNS
jgi:DNA-directed RNA polymerase specialized sigma24 family protein